MFTKRKFKYLLLSVFLGSLFGILVVSYIDLREDVKKYKWYSTELEKIVNRFSDPSLIIITLEAFNEKFVHFDKLENDVKREFIASTFFEYKNILEITDIDQGLIEEFNDMEKYLCEKYDCSKFRKAKPDKKNIPKQQHP